MPTIPRLSPAEVRQRLRDDGALLVCAYDDDSRCREASIDGAITLQELKRRERELDPAQKLVFYCA